MQLFSQRDPRWRNKELGWGPPGSTIGLYGCDETCDSMILWDTGLLFGPDALDDIYIAHQIFSRDPDGSGDYDLLTDDALARTFPSRFRVETVWGFDGARITAAVNSPDTYVKLWISTPSVPTHFVIAYSANAAQIADPWTGQVGSLAGYGGPAAVKKMVFVTSLPDTSAQQAAAAAAAKAAAEVAAKAAADAAAAQAAQDALAAQHAADAAAAKAAAEAQAAQQAAEAQAAADAKAAADVAAAKAAAEAQAAADAKAAADAVAAKAAADAAAAKAAADAAASQHTIPLPTPPPPYGASQSALAVLQTILIAIGRALIAASRTRVGR